MELAQQIAARALAQQRLDQGSDGSVQERDALECQSAQGHEARQRLIQANLCLVVSIAEKYHSYALSMMGFNPARPENV